MKILLVVVIIFFSGIKNLHASQIPCEGDNEVYPIIKDFGNNEKRKEFRLNLQKLAERPANAVCYLINELRVVKEKKITQIEKDTHEASLHIIWCVRALRYLTGLDFKGETKYKFKKTEETREYWLKKESKQNLPFFAVWMSRDSIYIAPEDTQKEIIEKWKEWYSNNGKNYNYKPLDDIDKWYF